jgi:nitroreductase
MSPADVDAMADVARWSGSSSNEQPWRFIVIRDAGVLRRLAEAGRPMTRPLATATAAIAIVLPDEKERAVSRAYDEGRAAERILVAASMLGLAGGVSWIINDARATVREILGIPADHFVRTIIALGHPTEGARRPKSAPGQARLPRRQVVFEERWPA